MPKTSSRQKPSSSEVKKQKTEDDHGKVKRRLPRKKEEKNNSVKLNENIQEAQEKFNKNNEDNTNDIDIKCETSTEFNEGTHSKNTRLQKKPTQKKNSVAEKFQQPDSKVLAANNKNNKVIKIENELIESKPLMDDSVKIKRKRKNEKTINIKVEIADDENISLKPKRGKKSKIQTTQVIKDNVVMESDNKKPKEKRKLKKKKNDYTEDQNVEGQMNKQSGRVKKIKKEKIDPVIESDLEFEFKTIEPPVQSFKKTGKKYVGAHVSINGGLANAVTNAIDIGAKSFAIFLRSQRQWVSKPLTEEAAALFRNACQEHKFPPQLIIPHGSYLLNCGSPHPETLRKSREALVEELKRCEMLGLTMFNFHPGSTCGEITREECLDRIAESINKAHEQTKYVISVVENMSCQGHTIGGDFKELRGIIDRVKDKSRIGVCLDTCHAFAAGYDLSKYEGFEKMMDDFESIIGLEYLKAVHINDSQGKLGCHLDRHENIGKGHIGLEGFRNIMNDSRFNDIPLILETPANLDDAKEIKILYNLCK